eukprot:6249173-Amphidinium_carterae.1
MKMKLLALTWNDSITAYPHRHVVLRLAVVAERHTCAGSCFPPWVGVPNLHGLSGLRRCPSPLRV